MAVAEVQQQRNVLGINDLARVEETGEGCHGGVRLKVAKSLIYKEILTPTPIFSLSECVRGGVTPSHALLKIETTCYTTPDKKNHHKQQEPKK